jgi:hypothetical protein
MSSKETWACMKANIHFGTLGQENVEALLLLLLYCNKMRKA